MGATLGRRERLRAETAREIKTIARKQLAEQGAAAISLRAIAREMGMTAGAIYSYFGTRDALITELISDVYSAFTDRQQAALAALPADAVAERILVFGEQYRNWAVSRPEEFQLVYGAPVPGYQPSEGGGVADAERRACAFFGELVAAAWSDATRSGQDFAWSDFGEEFAAAFRAEHPGLPPAAAGVALRVWGRMHGLVSLEVYGHLTPQSANPEALYRAELVDLIAWLGLTPPE
ncbi:MULTISPECIES: TetR/AcrR family transcriptional regulator [unclassified Streptomyces]|uniref:TetR/AcrR family transcriptional regulator n=1 Tax=unclassified Streptomyces TaxID=2593676 RepID=UPI0036F92B27